MIANDWGKKKKKLQRSLRRAESKFCLHQTWETASKLKMPDSSYTVHKCREKKGWKVKAQTVISFSLKNQQPCSIRELGLRKHLPDSHQHLNVEDLWGLSPFSEGYYTSMERKSTAEAAICICGLSSIWKSTESSLTSLGSCKKKKITQG